MLTLLLNYLNFVASDCRCAKVHSSEGLKHLQKVEANFGHHELERNLVVLVKLQAIIWGKFEFLLRANFEVRLVEVFDCEFFKVPQALEVDGVEKQLVDSPSQLSQVGDNPD